MSTVSTVQQQQQQQQRVQYGGGARQGATLPKPEERSTTHGEQPTAMEAEKRIRREIANSNERRRMQSINAGFQSLRSLLPHHEGEKLSKAAILQQTAEYIYSLEQEKTRLLSQNCHLKRLMNQQHEAGDLPPKKRKTEVIINETVTVTDECPEAGDMILEPADHPVEVRGRTAERDRGGFRTIIDDQMHRVEYERPYHHLSDDEPEVIGLQVVTADSLPPVGHTQTVVCSPPVSRSPSPQPMQEERLPSVLEAAIKAEPKVEVERLPSPSQSPHERHEETVVPNRIYVGNTSRQNLETIVEAIRHLEGDHMFAEEPVVQTHEQHQAQPQEAPLALTTGPRADNVIKLEMSPFIDFVPALQQRPGVIVVKQAS